MEKSQKTILIAIGAALVLGISIGVFVMNTNQAMMNEKIKQQFMQEDWSTDDLPKLEDAEKDEGAGFPTFKK